MRILVKTCLGMILAFLMIAPMAASAQTVATSSSSILQQVLSLQQLVDSLQTQISQLEAQINQLTNGGGTLSQPAQITGTSSSLPNIFAPVSQNLSGNTVQTNQGSGTAAQNLLFALQSPTGFILSALASTTATTTSTTTASAAPTAPTNDSMCPVGERWMYGYCTTAISP